LLFPL